MVSEQWKNIRATLRRRDLIVGVESTLDIQEKHNSCCGNLKSKEIQKAQAFKSFI